MTRPAPDATAASRPDPPELLIRVVGGMLVCWLAVLSAVAEAFLVPLRYGSSRIPVAVLLALAGNLALPWLARWLTRSRLVTTLPAVLWFLVILVFAGGTAEGDVVLAGNDWVAVVLLLLGSASAAAGGYFALLGVVPRFLRGIARAGR